MTTIVSPGTLALAAASADGLAPRRKTRYLHPGQVLACLEPTTLTTVLGSCVSVCLWDRRRGIGAMNHYVLPHWSDGHEQSSRFGPIAISRLLDRMLALGGTHADIEAKLFGGAWILASAPRPEHVGAQNVLVARARLAEIKVPIVAEDVGGNRGRKLVFETETGVALVKKL